jgi:hypothetical protein
MNLQDYIRGLEAIENSHKEFLRSMEKQKTELKQAMQRSCQDYFARTEQNPFHIIYDFVKQACCDGYYGGTGHRLTWQLSNSYLHDLKKLDTEPLRYTENPHHWVCATGQRYDRLAALAHTECMQMACFLYDCKAWVDPVERREIWGN